MMSVQNSRAPHVAIIGCGVSGLRCADILLQSGARVTIFEAGDRIGGRLHQIETGGYLVDVGANWIHEPKNNPILQLAKHSDTIAFERPIQQVTFDRHGNRFANETAMRLKATLWALVGEAEDQSLKNWANIDPQDSMLDWIRMEASSRYRDEPEFRDALIDEAQRLGQFFGDPASTISLKFACMEKGTGGKDLFLASTYRRVLGLLEERISGKCTVKLKMEVIHIHASSDSDSKVQVETSDGNAESFDEVVASCPLGWLKKNKERVFSPAVPARLSEAISNLRYPIQILFIHKAYLTSGKLRPFRKALHHFCNCVLEE
jgi:predicted NAD/FAD-binding protein